MPSRASARKVEPARARVDEAPRTIRTAAAVRSRRNPRWIAAGVLAMCVGGLGSAALYSQATSAAPVLRINQTVPRGQVVQETDLSVVSVAPVPGVVTVPANKRGEIVGLRALTDLPGGTLLAPNTVGKPPVREGTVHIGLRLAPGRAPSTPIPVGTRVLLIPVAGSGAGASEAPAETTFKAEIVSIPAPAPDGTQVFDVAVAAADAARIARLAAAEQLVVVREAG